MLPERCVWLSTRTERFIFLRFVDKLCRAPGRVPKKLASLTNLATLNLVGNSNLQVPGGAQTLNGDMVYRDREAVAGFQACLK